jgi:signal peptidase I
MSNATATAPAKLRWTLRVYRWLRGCLAMFGLGVILYSISIDLDQILSPSMSPALQGTSSADGDWVLSEKVSYWFRKPRRWEIVCFTNDDGIRVMKRVGGLPHEMIGVDDAGHAVIDGRTMIPPASLSYLHYYAYGPLVRQGKQTSCGDGYFVFGDDSRDSQDSRYDGPIAPSRIRARAWIRVWPLSRIGWVNP